MTIASEIERLQNVRTDIYDELGNKCVNLDGSSKYADVAPIIKKMPVVCAKIGANKYPVVKIGNQLWTAKNLDEDLGALADNEWYYNGRTHKTRINYTTSTKEKISSTYKDLIFEMYDWEDGSRTVGWVKELKSKSHSFGVHCHAEISFSEPLKSSQRITFFFRAFDYGPAYISKDFTINAGESSFVINASVVVPNEDYNTGRSLIRLVQNESNAGIEATASNVRICYGTEDCGANAIDVPTALANEATYKKYGRLYTWDNVNTNLASLGLQGWRMPTKEDFNALVAIDGTGEKFRSKTWGSGTDDYGLNVRPSGNYTGTFSNINAQAFLWSNTSYRCRINTAIIDVQESNKAYGFSVRLVCDLNEDGSIPDGAVIIAEADEESVATLSEDGVAVASVEPSTDTEG